MASTEVGSVYPILSEATVDIENDRERQAAVSLLSSQNEFRPYQVDANCTEEQKVRAIFDYYDTNMDGYLDLREMRQLIRQGGCDKIKNNVVKKLLKRADQNNDDKLSFDEFSKMHKSYRWIVNDIYNSFTSQLIPHPANKSGPAVVQAKHKPWMMISISILQIAIFYFEYFKNKGSLNGTNADDALLVNSKLSLILRYDPTRKAEVWRFVTYMLLHAGQIHLAMNMMLQFILGVSLEIYNGWWRVLIVYLAGGIGGCLGHAVFIHKYLKGASGGDYALLTAHIATVIMNWREMPHAIVQLFVVGVYCIISVIITITEDTGDVSNAAHGFGALAGLLIGICVLVNIRVQDWERKLSLLSIGIATILTIIGICYL